MASYLHTCYRIGDIDRSVSFYEKLGFGELRGEQSVTRPINVFMGLPGEDPVLELTYNHGVDSYELGTGYNHIAIAVDDLEGTLGALSSDGIEPEKPPYRPGGRTEGSFIAFVRDPDGYRVRADRPLVMRARAIAVAVLIAACAAPSVARCAVEAGHDTGRGKHRPGRPRADGGWWAARRLVAPHRPEYRGSAPHADLALRGGIGASTPIQSGWTGFTNAAVVVEPGGLRAFWGGFRTTDSSDPQRETNTALSRTAARPGASARPGIPTAPSRMRVRRRPCAAMGRRCRRSPARSARGSTRASRRRRRTSTTRAARPVRLRPEPRDGRGQPDSVAWYSSATGHLGVQVQDVSADGSPVGSPAHDARHGRHEAACSPGRRSFAQRRRLLRRISDQPGVVRVGLWGIGASNAPLIARMPDRHPRGGDRGGRRGADVGAVDKGLRRPGRARRRSNRGATRFGATVNAGHPRDAMQAFKLDTSAAGGALDVLGNFNIGTTSTAVTSYRRILPGLTLGEHGRAGFGRASRRRCASPCIDAGAPVKGATVRVGGQVRDHGQGRPAW